MVKNKKVMRTICGTILAVAVASAARADRIDDIMAKMTLREKIGQCVQIELAKIPLSNATIVGDRPLSTW